MDLMEIIKSRRSVREFENKNVDDNVIEEILTAGQWAPSGLNNQPWKFCIIKNEEKKNALSQCTKYNNIVLKANFLIAVFYDLNKGYDRTKDVLAIGACIQNMLLYIHQIGLGACWLGEILNKKEQVNNILGVHSNCELMAVIAVGYPTKKKRQSTRHKLKELLLPQSNDFKCSNSI